MTLCTVFCEEPTILESFSCRTKSLSKSTTLNQSFLARYHVAVPPVIASMTTSDNIMELPATFRPREFDIICGRGKGHYNKPGCKRMREIVRSFIPEYTTARTKFDKSTVLSRIVDAVKDDNNARFVRCKQGTWYELGDEQAREKVGHTIRETIALIKSGKSSPSVLSARNSPTQPVLVASSGSCGESSLLWPISTSREVSYDCLNSLTHELHKNGNLYNTIVEV
jgi:hypothetical protein